MFVLKHSFPVVRHNTHIHTRTHNQELKGVHPPAPDVTHCGLKHHRSVGNYQHQWDANGTLSISRFFQNKIPLLRSNLTRFVQQQKKKLNKIRKSIEQSKHGIAHITFPTTEIEQNQTTRRLVVGVISTQFANCPSFNKCLNRFIS